MSIPTPLSSKRTAAPGSDRIHRRKAEMLLDPTHAPFEFAYQHAMTEHGGVIFDHRPSQPGDLLAHFPAGRNKIRGDVGAKRLDFGPQFRFRQFNLCFNLVVEPRDIFEAPSSTKSPPLWNPILRAAF